MPAFKDQREQSLSEPADGSKLRRHIQSLIQIVRAIKDLLRFFEPNATSGVFPQQPTLAQIELKAHLV